MSDAPFTPLADHVLSRLFEGKMSPQQQKDHVRLLLNNDEYFESFFISVELWADTAQRVTRRRTQIVREKMRASLRLVEDTKSEV